MRPNKKKGRRKVPITNRLIDLSRKILRSLLPGGLNVNRVIDQTNLKDQTYFYETKKVLIKSKIIKQTEVDGREDIVELDETGRDLAILDDYVVRAQECYQTLLSVIREKFNIDIYHFAPVNSENPNQVPKVLRNKLREIGWDSDNLASYGAWVIEALFFERKTAYAYVIALCSKYTLFLSKIGNNEIARSILHRIISDAFDKHFSESIKLLPNDPETKIQLEDNAALMISGLDHPVYEYIKEYAHFDESKVFLSSDDIIPKDTNKFLKTELSEMVRSLFNIYLLGHEHMNKEAADIMQRSETQRNSSDHN